MSESKPWSAPYLGAAYYPEDWPLSQIDEDVRLMKEAGLNAARVGEFAWRRMEPQEGRYDFGWLQLAVEKLAAAGIATILGTPTPTPPVWLTERYPETLFVDCNGRSVGHGGRRHACPNSPVYRELCAKIVARMAEEFGQDDRILGWQIDNEVFPHHPSRSCFCPVCVRKFREALRERFGTIEALNEAWCLDLWSMAYQSFEQIPVVRPDVWHHPSLLSAWDQFASDSYVDFVEAQADILHAKTMHPVGTDMMMIPGVDHYRINRKLDVAQFNHYHYRDALWESCFWFDYLRPVLPVPFWNTETSTSWSGSVATSGYSEPGFCRANSWLPVAFGGEANLFWLWRQHRAGQELMHGAVVTSQGRPMHMFGEVREVGDGFRRAEAFLNGTRPAQSGLAVHFSHRAHVQFRNTPMVNGFSYLRGFLDRAYRPLLSAQYRPDVLDPVVDLGPYRAVYSPFLPMLDESGLRERLRAWIEAGGTWIAGPLTDVFDMDGSKFTHAPFGCMEEWAGVYCRHQIPGEPRDFGLRFSDGSESAGSLWYDGLELRGAEPLATYVDGPLAGLAAAAQKEMDRGRIVVLGSALGADDLLRILSPLLENAGIVPSASASPNLAVVPREGPAGSGMVAVEYENRPAELTLDAPATDLLTGRELSGRVEVPPYGVLVLQWAGGQ